MSALRVSYARVHVTCAGRQAGRDRERERGEIGLAGISQKVIFYYQPQPLMH